MAAQVNIVLTINVQTVLLPRLSRNAERSADLSRAVLRVSRIVVVIGSLVSTWVFFLFPVLNSVAFSGTWSDAAFPIFLLSAVFPLRAIFIVPRTCLVAVGDYRRAALLTLGLGLGLAVCALLAATIAPNPTGIALAVSIYIGVAGIISLAVAADQAGIRAVTWTGQVARLWFICMVIPISAWLTLYVLDYQDSWGLLVGGAVFASAASLGLVRLVDSSAWSDVRVFFARRRPARGRSAAAPQGGSVRDLH
jgi:O-antigen/teichoic acid export membrane protein